MSSKDKKTTSASTRASPGGSKRDPVSVPERGAAGGSQAGPANTTAEASIGAALRDLRDEQELSARQLSDMAGVSTAMISRIENGQVSPSISTMSALSEALNVPIVSLFRDSMSAQVDFTHVRHGEGLKSTRMLNEHTHHFVNLANHRRRDLQFDAHLVTVTRNAGKPPSYVGHGVVFMRVIEGEAMFLYGRERLHLCPGDSLSLDAELTHGFEEILTPSFVFLNVQVESRHR